MAEEHEVCFTSQLANLAQIAQFVSERAALAGMDEAQAFEVQMAVDEACTNAMEHAYEGHADGQVFVCCYLDGDDFVVRITDRGRRFDPASVPTPDLSAPLEEREVGGLGLYLMRKLMDRVEFTPGIAEGNQVIMHKHRRSKTR